MIVCKLGDVFKTTSGGTPSRTNANYYNGNIPWVKSGELEANVITDTEEKISEEAIKNSSAKIFPKGTLLIALYGATIGKLARLGIEAATNQAVCGIFENEEHDIKYLYWFLFYKRRDLIKAGIGGAQPNISQTILKNLEITLPDKIVQQTIVSKIEELFSELDKSIETLRLAQQQLKTYRQAVLKWVFEGKLTEEWRKENGTSVRIQAGSPETYAVSSGIESELIAAETQIDYQVAANDLEISHLPKGWKWTTLSSVASKITDGEHFRPKTQESGIPFLSAKDIRDEGVSFRDPLFISDETAKRALQRCNPERDDILMVSRGATVGRMCIVKTDEKFCLLGSVILIKVNKSLNSKFITYILKSPFANQKLISISGATAQQAIYLRDIKDLAIPICSIDEQNRIVQEIEGRFSVADKMEESIIQSLQQAEALRQSILKKAFEGKLVVEKKPAVYKPKSEYFYQVQLLGLIARASKKKEIAHGEMTIAKYAYLVDKIYGVPTYYDYKRWHLGPYPPEMKKAVSNKNFFKKQNGNLGIADEESLLKYNNHYQKEIETAVADLAEIFSKYSTKERAHKTELLATVCKVVEDIQTLDLQGVRASMKEWKIDLETSSFKNKAEKFTEPETEKCLIFMNEKGWSKKLLKIDLP